MEGIPMRALAIKRGERFGELTVIGEVESIVDGERHRRAFELKCDCGNICVKTLINLNTGKTRSCGCLFVAALGNARTHGRSKDAIYEVWSSMRKRCENQNSKSYSDYGGRGIKVCERWQKFENFLADMGERPSPQHE